MTDKETDLGEMKVKPYSVAPLKLPTEFAEFNADMSVYEKPFVNCAGCENKNASPRLVEKLAKAIMNHPELVWDHWNPQDKNLRQKIATLHDVSIDQVFITSGAIAGIDYCFKIFGREGTKTGLLKPDWPGFLHYVEFYKNSIQYVENLDFPFIIDAKKINDFVKAKEIELMLFANPVPVNGYLIEEKEIEKLLQINPETLFVIDEADTVNPRMQSARLAKKYDNVIFLGSLSKFYGLSGLRIGYLITPQKYAKHFKNTINVIEVSSLAILAGNIILEDIEFQEWTQKNVNESIKLLQEACVDTPYEIYATPNCFACYIYSKNINPKTYLKEQNIKILEGQYFGLPDHVNGGRFNLSDPEKTKLVANKVSELKIVKGGNERKWAY